MSDGDRLSGTGRAVLSDSRGFSRTRLLAIGAFLLLLAGGVAWLLEGWGSGGGYIAHNTHILRQIKDPPGTRVVGTSSAPYYPEGGVAGLTAPAGYTTAEKVVVNGRVTTRSLMNYYRSTLTGWKCNRQPTRGQLIVQCIRGRAYVTFNFLTFSSRPSSYTVTADYDGVRGGG